MCMKFGFKLHKTAVETYRILKFAFEEEAISRSPISKWFSKCKSRRASVEEAELLVCLQTGKTDENVIKIRKFVQEKHHHLQVTQ